MYMNIERLFELAGLPNNDLLLESPAQLLTTLKKDFPNNVNEIDDNINKARSMFKTANEKLAKGDRLEWYMGILKAYLSNDINSVKGTYNFKDMETFNHDLFHYYGYNISEIQNTELTNQNISQLFDTFQSYIDKYKKSPKAPVPVQHSDYELIKCNDGTSWWFIDRAYCEEEGRSGQHCGNVVGKHDTSQRILSLRTPNHNVILTFILESNGYLGEMKAKANQKPSEKYHPNIMQLLLNPIVKGIKGAGYASYMNFSIFDLSDNDIKILINHGKQNFIADQIKAEPVEFLKAPDYIKSVKEYQQIAIKASPALEHLIGSENDLDAWEQAIDENESLIIYAPHELPNFKSMVTQRLTYHPEDILKAPKSVSQDFDILKAVLEKKGFEIQYVIPNTPRYNELCKIAVSNSAYALKVIPENLITFELCKVAVANDGRTLEFVPENLITFELCKLAVSDKGGAIRYVPLKDFTNEEQLEICKIAVTESKIWMKYVPDRLKDKVKQELNIQESLDFKYFQNL